MSSRYCGECHRHVFSMNNTFIHANCIGFKEIEPGSIVYVPNAKWAQHPCLDCGKYFSRLDFLIQHRSKFHLTRHYG